MKSDTSLPRAFLKLVLALKLHPDWDLDALIAGAAEAHGVDPEALRRYATDDMGLLAGASVVEAERTRARADLEGR